MAAVKTVFPVREFFFRPKQLLFPPTMLLVHHAEALFYRMYFFLGDGKTQLHQLMIMFPLT